MSARGLFIALFLATSTAAFAAPSPPAASEDIRDIRGPVSIPPWWRWLAIVGAGLATVAIAAAGVRALRRSARPLTLHELALQKLDEAQRLADDGQARAYALLASDAVRGYIEQRFHLAATHATTEEFFAELSTHGELGAHRESLAEFLEACDLAKFARVSLPASALTDMNDRARAFVLSTVPAEAQSPVARSS